MHDRYYSATLFASIGFRNPTAVGLIVSGTNFLGTLFALKYIDIIGRRRILTWSVPGMVIGLLLASISFHFLTINTGGVLDPSADYPSAWSGLVLFSMVFYVLSYATGIGNLPWQQSELFPISYVCSAFSPPDFAIDPIYAAGTRYKPRDRL
jgi:SP family myo-inositol transporter-like MFS transporter 13